MVKPAKCSWCHATMYIKKVFDKKTRPDLDSIPDGKVRILWECPECKQMKNTHRKVGTKFYPDEEYKKREAERLREYRKRKKQRLLKKQEHKN